MWNILSLHATYAHVRACMRVSSENMTVNQMIWKNAYSCILFLFLNIKAKIDLFGLVKKYS